MRKVFLVLASSMAVAFAACDRNANNNRAPAPSSYGGGPSSNVQGEHVGSSTQSTFDDGNKAAPVGSAAHELPGMSGGMATDSNGGSGAGLTGSQGHGTTLPNGVSDQGDEKRPPSGQK